MNSIENPQIGRLARQFSLPGTMLPVAETTAGQEVCEISIETTPEQRTRHMENFADNFGEGWLDHETVELRMQFHLVCMFANAAIEEVTLVNPNGVLSTPLKITRTGSPAVGQRHAGLEWATQSRFVVDETIQLTERDLKAERFDIISKVEGVPYIVGFVHLGDMVGGRGRAADGQTHLSQPGARLQLPRVASDRILQEVSVEIIPAHKHGLLVNFVDNLGTGWLDRKKHQMRLQFEAVAVFGEGVIDGLYVALPGQSEMQPLSPRHVASPPIAQRFSDLPWAGQSRFLLDEVLALPGWAARADALDLMAEVAGKFEKLGTIRVGPTCRIQIGHEQPAPLIPRTALTIARQYLLRAVNYVRSMNRIFLFTVALPSLIATTYFGLIASDVYVSESKFVVRSPNNQSLFSPLGMMLKGTDFGRAQDDSYSVQEFILSRDALRRLNEQMAIRKGYANPNVDRFSRFDGFGLDDSFEALYKYYRKMVDVQVDSASSIITLTTRDYSADDSQRANQLLLTMSEALVNQLNENGRQDMIRFAERETAEAEKRDDEATLALARVQTGGSHGPLAGRLAEYQLLSLKKEYADKLLATALSSLEEARSQALRKQLYLERIEQPSKPDIATEPKRLRLVVAVFVLSLLVWGVLTMLIAGIREHQD